jgi:DNA-binding response OmpR family regulator
VLVLEDDSDQRELVAEILSAAGYDVRVAANGLVAREALSQSPDAVLLDLNGVGDDGFWAALEAVSPRPARLLVSGDPHLRELARTLQADAVVMKPFSLNGLLAQLALALKARESASGLWSLAPVPAT